MQCRGGYTSHYLSMMTKTELIGLSGKKKMNGKKNMIN